MRAHTGRLFVDNKELEEQGLEKHVLEGEGKKEEQDSVNKVGTHLYTCLHVECAISVSSSR